jgi:hypothetical protein
MIRDKTRRDVTYPPTLSTAMLATRRTCSSLSKIRAQLRKGSSLRFSSSDASKPYYVTTPIFYPNAGEYGLEVRNRL